MTATGHYTIEIDTATHDDLRAGRLATRTSRIRISADEATTDHQAILLACQMAACTSDAMPTDARLLSWPT